MLLLLFAFAHLLYLAAAFLRFQPLLFLETSLLLLLALEGGLLLGFFACTLLLKLSTPTLGTLTLLLLPATLVLLFKEELLLLLLLLVISAQF